MLKIGLITTCVIGSFYTVCQHSTSFRGNVLFRLGRTAFTVSSMTIDYKLFYLTTSPIDSNYDLLLSNVHKKAAEKLLALTIVNGGCFIKVGQHLGSLTYLLPDEYVNTLKILHDNVPNELYENIYQIIKEEIGVEPSNVFYDMSTSPIGTASLAQVHYGKLKKSDIEVAIKVQHREVKDHSMIDLMCMDILFSIISKLFSNMQLEWLAEETRKNLPQELNFIQEGKNAENLRDRLSNKLPFLKIPKIYWEYSTERLLVMEYFHGGKVNDRNYIEANSICPKKLSKNLSKLYSEMIFGQGYFHSDPHPGNILIRSVERSFESWWEILKSKFWKKYKKSCEIVLLDHGLYQTLSHDFLLHYSRLWLHIINKDERGIKEESVALGVKNNMHRLLACMVAGRSWEALENGISDTEFSISEGQHMRINANLYMNQMIDILNSLPRQMLLILKTNDLLRGVEHSLLGTPYHCATLGIMTMTGYCISIVYDQEMELLFIKHSYIIAWLNCTRWRLRLYWNLLHLYICSLRM